MEFKIKIINEAHSKKVQEYLSKKGIECLVKDVKYNFVDNSFIIFNAETNAKLIVKAVNNHDRLVELLDRLVANYYLENRDGTEYCMKKAKELLNQLEKEDATN